MADAARAATPAAPTPEKSAEAAQGMPSSAQDDDIATSRRGRSALRINQTGTGLNVPQG